MSEQEKLLVLVGILLSVIYATAFFIVGIRLDIDKFYVGWPMEAVSIIALLVTLSFPPVAYWLCEWTMRVQGLK